MTEREQFDAEVKAVEEFQKVSPSLSTLSDVTELMISNHVSRGRLDHTPPLMSFQREVHYPSPILPM
jgi:hypothetical protein